MIIYVEVLRRGIDIAQVLGKDGWTVNDGWHHSDVADEGAARHRLCRLGILTSSALRIEFDRRRRPLQG